MPERPTLKDFFLLRFGPIPRTHLLQSARVARENGLGEKVIMACRHRWYMTSRLVTINDIYSFDPGVGVDYDEFEDVVCRNFRQPEEGLGFDGSPVAHMWR